MTLYSQPDKGGDGASGSTEGVKIGKSLGLIRQVSGAGAGITPCWSGGSGRCSWTGRQLLRPHSGSILPHNKLLHLPLVVADEFGTDWAGWGWVPRDWCPAGGASCDEPLLWR